MERMGTSIIRVENDLNGLHVFNDKRMGVFTVNDGVTGKVIGSRHGSEKSRNARRSISNVVEEGVVDTVQQVVHGDGKFNVNVRFRKEFDAISGDEIKVIESFNIVGGVVGELINFMRSISVVLKPVGSVVGETVFRSVKEPSVKSGDDGVVSVGSVFSSQEDSVTLGSSDVDSFNFLGFDVDTVDFDNGHIVIFEPEKDGTKGTNIHEMEKISGIWLNRDGDVEAFVEDEILRDGFCTSGVINGQELWVEDVHNIVVPIGDSEGEFFINLVGKVGIFVVDDERGSLAVRILARSVGVIPVGTVLVSHKVIGHVCAWRNGALIDKVGAIHGVCTVLIEAVEMDGSVSVAESVVEVDDNAVTFVDIDAGQRPFAVDADDWTGVLACGVSGDPRDGPVKSFCSGMGGSCHDYGGCRVKGGSLHSGRVINMGV